MRALTIALTVFAFACAGEPTELTATTPALTVHVAQATTTPAEPTTAEAAEEPAQATCPYAHLHGEEADPAEVAAATAAHGDCPHKQAAQADAAAAHGDCPHKHAEAEAAAGKTCPHHQAGAEAEAADTHPAPARTRAARPSTPTRTVLTTRPRPPRP